MAQVIERRERDARQAPRRSAVSAEACAALELELKRALEGVADFSAGARALFATDASNYRHTPLGVVTPRSAADVVRAVEICRRHRAPITPRGGGTALAGQTCNETVIIDFSRWLTKVLEIDPQARRARVEPGCILDDLRDAARPYDLTFGPDPATHTHNTLGGMIGNDSCGPHSVYAGRTSDNVERLDVLTYDGLRLDVGATSEKELRGLVAAGGRRGQIYRDMRDLIDEHAGLIRARFPRLPRRVSGFANLDALLPENGFDVARALVGTEANCVIVLGATLRLVEHPPCRALAVVRFDDVFAAADAVPRMLKHKPLAIEGIDRGLVDRIHKKRMRLEALEAFEEGGGWLLVEFGGASEAEARAKAQAVSRSEGADRVRVLSEAHEQDAIWNIRESGLGATTFVPGQPDTFAGWEDSAVPPERLGKYLRRFHTLMQRYGYDAALYGHFGDGLVHCNIDFDLRTRDGVRTWRAFLDEAADLVVSMGGSLSGEHGDGQARGELLEKMYGRELVACFARFKAIWDPDGRLNPGKVVAPYRVVSNLRLGPDHPPVERETQFAFKADKGSFARASERCVGVGKCRRREVDEDVMCPSYLATGEEQHSTRGRARLLFEMLRGETITSGWDSPEVEEALSLCLACKGCLSDCPVNVDIATYKAEFRYHHYRRKWRPRAAYALGMVHKWAPLMALAPPLANGVLNLPGLGAAARWIAGVAPDARLPRLAGATFRAQSLRQRRPPRGDRVVLWADTFNNYFHVSPLQAAEKVLAAEGYGVTTPGKRLCCGRPLYDWGFLETARRLWRKTIDALTPDIQRGTPIVVVEPACLSAFKHELPDLLPDNDLAERLSEQAVGFAEFVLQRPVSQSAEAAVLLQPHCHAHAMGQADDESKLLTDLGAQVEPMNEGCCGMAGSFGLDKGTRQVAMSVAERGVLPKVRAADQSRIIVASGFSCREQIQQGAERDAMHIAEFAAARMLN